MHISLELPFPPSVNHYWGQRGKARFITKRGMDFRCAVVEECIRQGISAIDGRLAVHIALFPPDKRKRDVDNILKALLDACEHAGCYESDSQIDELHVIRQGARAGGGCTVIILPIG